jgi:DMSO reductase anchor subunit
MLGILFPPVIDRTFRGQLLGFWLLAPVLLLKVAVAALSIVAPQQANSADAIDVSSFSEAALREATLSTALLGLLHLCIGLIGVLAMARYRAMVPLIYLWLLVESLGRRVVLALYPIDRAGDASNASIMNTILLSLMILGLALSVWPRRPAPGAGLGD